MTGRTFLLTVMLLGASSGLAHAGGSVVVGALTTTEVQVPDDRGHLEHFGSGAGASILVLSTKDEFPSGLEANTLFLIGESGERLYNLGLSLVGSFRMDRKAAVPFVAFGLDLAAASVPDSDGIDRGVTLGVHGNVGLHGFIGKEIYWRGQVGFLGAGVGALTGSLSLGYVFGKG